MKRAAFGRWPLRAFERFALRHTIAPAALTRFCSAAVAIELQNKAARPSEKASTSGETERDEQFAALTQLFAAQSRERLRQVYQEYASLKNTPKSKMPEMSAITQQQWCDLMELEPRQARIAYFWRITHLNWCVAESIARRQRRNARLEIKAANGSLQSERTNLSSQCVYSFQTPHFNATYADRVRGARLASALRLRNPSVVIDLSLLKQLNAVEQPVSLLMVKLCAMRNACHKLPFCLHFTGVDYEASYWQSQWQAAKQPLDLQAPMCDTFVNHTAKCYTDLFPRDKLVYMTPDSPNALETFDADKTYVIGAAVDIYSTVCTLDKARAQGIATASLPLAKFTPLEFVGDVRLPMHEVLNMLLDLHLHGDIQRAVVDNLPQQRKPSKLFTRRQSRKAIYVGRLKKLDSILAK